MIIRMNVKPLLKRTRSTYVISILLDSMIKFLNFAVKPVVFVHQDDEIAWWLCEVLYPRNILKMKKIYNKIVSTQWNYKNKCVCNKIYIISYIHYLLIFYGKCSIELYCVNILTQINPFIIILSLTFINIRTYTISNTFADLSNTRSFELI